MTNRQTIFESIYPITLKDALADLAKLNPSLAIGSQSGCKFLNFFVGIERLNTTSKHGKTFFEFLDDKEYEKYKALLSYYKTNRPNYPLIRGYYRIYSLTHSSINLFRPIIAMDIYNRFRPTCILDPTCGWGGRMLAAAKMNIDYVGIDSNPNLVPCYEKMIPYLSQIGTSKMTFISGDCLDINFETIPYDMVFSSPPYYNIELYNGMDKRKKNEWNDWYKSLFEKSWKSLKKGGWACWNVSPEIFNKSLLPLLGESTFKIPLQKYQRNKSTYSELIYCWNKVSD